MFLVDVLTVFILAVLIGASVTLWVSTPVVEIDHVSGECVKVEPERAGSCDDIPRIHDRLIVGRDR